MSDLRRLVQALDTTDLQAQRAAGQRLAAIGAPALPVLVSALRSDPPVIRRAVAFLLGRFRGHAAAAAALEQAVQSDPEPKVRKNAAVSLGSIGGAASIAALTAAVEREAVAWVRPSLILALGALGGPTARATLETLSAATPDEQAALQKALDRVSDERGTVWWREEQPWPWTLQLAVPEGLEDVALAEAQERGLPGIRLTGRGQLVCAATIAPWAVLPALRTVSAALLVAGTAPALPQDIAAASAAISALIGASAAVQQWRTWLTTDQPALRYRFALVGRQLQRPALRQLLDAVRAVAAPLGWHDSPSHYDVELIVEGGVEATTLLISPAFQADQRFSYRLADVGAALNPVVAAALARLLPPAPLALDPTCGSGTLLIEYGLRHPGAALQGLDISATAVVAAQQNSAAAGLAPRCTLRQTDAHVVENWPVAGAVLANLPFGLRTARQDTDLAALYAAVFANLVSRLAPAGQALLVTSNRQLLVAAFAPHRRQLRLAHERRVQTGGLRLFVWILERTAAQRRP